MGQFRLEQGVEDIRTNLTKQRLVKGEQQITSKDTRRELEVKGEQWAAKYSQEYRSGGSSKGEQSGMVDDEMDSISMDLDQLRLVKGTQTMLDNSEKLENGMETILSGLEGMDLTEQPYTRSDGKMVVTAQILKGLRHQKWKDSMGWVDDDLDRKVYSDEVLPELLQDFETEMVLVGSDVISLYPNLEVEKVVESVREAVLKSNIQWEDVDYREGVRYLALNWDLEQCKCSNLRRVLPVRRGKRGTRPGLKGAGPRGMLKGDQEQWEFRNVVLEPWEKKQILSEVVSLATKAMFCNHFYKFGGVMYHQQQGDPIGLRGTCAVARLVMQLFDGKWGTRLDNLNITR